MTTPHDTIRPGDQLPDDEALLAWARFLHGQGDGRGFSLWLTFLDADDRALPVLVPIDDVPASPDPEIVTNLVDVLHDVLADQAPGGSAVLMLERPGTDAVSVADGRWFSSLHETAAARGVRLRGVFLATPYGVRPLTPDDA